MRVKKVEVCLFVCAFMLYTFLCHVHNHLSKSTRLDTKHAAGITLTNRTNAENKENGQELSLPVFVFALCKGESIELQNTVGKRFGGDIQRQLDQATVLIKSATALTSQFLRFIILVDKDFLFETISKRVSKWPNSVKGKFELVKRKVWFPKERKEFRRIYRVCSTERIFLINQLPNLDSIVYLDTDTVFMRPPEELWAHFNKFDSLQLSAMAPNLNYYNNPGINFPYYGSTGLNAGVWLMNLTRMRAWPAGWIRTEMEVYDRYKHLPLFTLVDQDIANVIFSQNPDYLYELGCQWNYRMFLCASGVNTCPAAAEKGVALMHGNALAFYANKDYKIKRVYDTWKKFEPGGSLKKLLKTLNRSLKDVDEMKLKSNCSLVEDIDAILMRGFEDFVNVL